MSERTDALLRACWSALDLGGELPGDAIAFRGDGDLPSAFAVTDLAAASIGCAALSVARLAAHAGGGVPKVEVDRRLASFWFLTSIRPIGWALPGPWDPIAGDYRCADGWIKLHTNAPHHRVAAQRVLGPHADRATMAVAVASWKKGELEAAVVSAGGCAAEMRSQAEWAEHPQGRAVAAEPLVHIERRAARTPWLHEVDPSRPLRGVRVLDLTRVLAGPIATRFLAGHGAEVLRIDPPTWDEPAIVPEVTLGKRTARLDLASTAGRERFQSLLEGADVLVHGLRPDALDGLGLGAGVRRARAPDLIEVSLDAYGWSGPWAGRRGFDSLVQMSSGIAEAGMAWKKADRPVPLPVQAVDHATGYLMAAAAVRGIARRLRGDVDSYRCSLARTALLLTQAQGRDAVPIAPETPADRADGTEATSWGAAQRLRPPAVVDGAPMRWNLPARMLGSDEPAWGARRTPT